jgi:myosin heavy subunit
MTDAGEKWWEEKKEITTIWQACEQDGQEYYYNTETHETTWDKPEELMTEDEKDGAGKWFWVPDSKLAFVPGKVVDTDGDFSMCELENGQEVKVKTTELEPLKKSSLQRIVEDLVLLDRMSAPMILHNLRHRFERDLIYTQVGTIVISVNPYQRFPDVYSDQTKDKYIHRGMKSDFPPHVYNIGYNAYKGMSDFSKNQSVIISGESGAGKTEATKQVLSFLAKMAGSTGGVEQKILQANPILEAFGNAKTVRNDNSSRFGKYMEVFFDQKGRICGSLTKNYLLEKIRVVRPMQSERNFHIFYQLVTSSSAAEKKALHILGPVTDYSYLTLGDCTTVDTIDDRVEYKDVQSAFRDLGFSSTEVTQVLELVSTVMTLGNVNFSANGQGYAQTDSKSSKWITAVKNLMKVDEKVLQKGLVTTVLRIRGQGGTEKPMDVAGAIDSRDSLAKFIYGRLFDWIVQRVNKSMGTAPKGCNYIGILDIFGFEIFKKNSFEQLCINYTNEMLQQHFNKHTFKLEEAMYKREGIRFSHVDFVDNQPMIELITKKPNGVLRLLDEELKVPRASDATFIQKLKLAQKKNKKFEKVLKNPNQFYILHYAGKVKYDTAGFLEKNRDTLSPDLLDMLATTQHPLLQILFPASEAGATTSQKKSLGAQFSGQLDRLMSTLDATEPHYIRCIKPNNEKAPRTFTSKNCMEQLTYSGVFEAVSIRKQGYPFRLEHKTFVDHYGVILNQGNDIKSKCLNIIKELKLNMENVQMGSSKVFYRADEFKKLELIRGIKVMTIKINDNLTRLVRTNTNGMAKGPLDAFLVDLARGVRQADEFRITTKVADDARALLEHHIEQRMDPETKRELQNAQRTKELADLEAVLFKCNQHGYRTSDTRACTALLEKVTDAEAAMKVGRSELDAAILERALGMAADFDYTGGTVAETQELLDNVTNANEQLTAALASKDHEDLQTVLEFCASFGYSTSTVRSASDLLNSVLRVRRELVRAIEQVSRDMLDNSVASAEDLGYDSDLVQTARVLQARVWRIDEETSAAFETMEEEHVRAVVAAAGEIGMRTEFLDSWTEMVNGDYGVFLAAQYAKAHELKDADRAIRIAIKQKDHFNTTPEAKQFANVWNYPAVRTDIEWASARFLGLGAHFGTEKRALRMKVWQADTIHAVLTNMSASEERLKIIQKEALKVFKALQVHMGDKTDKKAADNLSAALQLCLSSPEIRNEAFLHIFKMITTGLDEKNPQPTAEKVDKAWEIMALYLCVFPPDTALENYLESQFRNSKNSANAQRWRCDGLLRRRVYHQQVVAVPTPAQLLDVPGFIRSQDLTKFDDPPVTDPSYADLLEEFQPFEGAAPARGRGGKKKNTPPVVSSRPKTGGAKKTSAKKKSGGKKSGPPALAGAKKKSGPPALATSSKSKSSPKKTAAKKKTGGKPSRPVPKRPAARKPKPKPSPWKPILDEESGDTYYWNEETDAVTWDKPAGLP